MPPGSRVENGGRIAPVARRARGTAHPAEAHAAAASTPEVAEQLWVRVREATRSSHAAVEAGVGLPRSAATVEGYLDVLQRLLSVWGPLEQLVARTPGWRDVPLDPCLGRAAHLLERDVASLGGDVRQGAPASWPGEGREDLSLARAIGARYVLLGSARGGRMMAPVVERQLGVAHGVGTAFFRREGGDPGAEWRQFRVRTAAHLGPTASTALEEVVRGAHDAFAAIEAAFARTTRVSHS